VPDAVPARRGVARRAASAARARRRRHVSAAVLLRGGGGGELRELLEELGVDALAVERVAQRADVRVQPLRCE
jgi:hypothetical protein